MAYAEIHNSATFRFLSDSKLSDSLFQVSAGKKKSNLQKAGKKEKNKTQTQP